MTSALQNVCGECEGGCKSVSLLKFSGRSLSGVTYPADSGAFLVGGTASPLVPNDYPTTVEFSVLSLAVFLYTFVPPGGTLTVSVLKNGAPILSVVYEAGENLFRRATLLEPVTYRVRKNDRFDVRVTTTGTGATEFSLSGTVGILA